jgi:hypothetical protein
LNWYKYQENRLKRSRRYSFTREVLRFLEDSGMNYETAISPGYMLLTRESGFSPGRPFDFRKAMLHGRRKA